MKTDNLGYFCSTVPMSWPQNTSCNLQYLYFERVPEVIFRLLIIVVSFVTEEILCMLDLVVVPKLTTIHLAWEHRSHEQWAHHHNSIWHTLTPEYSEFNDLSCFRQPLRYSQSGLAISQKGSLLVDTVSVPINTDDLLCMCPGVVA